MMLGSARCNLLAIKSTRSSGFGPEIAAGKVGLAVSARRFRRVVSGKSRGEPLSVEMNRLGGVRHGAEVTLSHVGRLGIRIGAKRLPESLA